MPSAHQRFEKLSILPGKGIESPHAANGSGGLPRGEVVELFNRRRGIVDDNQSIQAPLVCQSRDLEVAKKIGHPFPHSNPFHEFPTLSSDALSDFEFLGIVDDHFDPKNRTGLVVHFQPVLFDAMFDPRTGDALQPDAGFHLRDDSTQKMPGQFCAKQILDILGAKPQGAVAEQTGEEFP
jgi:hypothetical protein